MEKTYSLTSTDITPGGGSFTRAFQRQKIEGTIVLSPLYGRIIVTNTDGRTVVGTLDKDAAIAMLREGFGVIPGPMTFTITWAEGKNGSGWQGKDIHNPRRQSSSKEGSP